MSIIRRQGWGRTLLLMVAAVIVAAFASGAAAQADEALVPFMVNVDATVVASNGSAQKQILATANQEAILLIFIRKSTGIVNGVQKQINSPTIISNRSGKVNINLPTQSYKSAEVLLYTVHGKRILQSNVSTASNITHPNLATGVYVLSVKRTDGNIVTSRLTHNGGRLNISVVFGSEALSSNKRLAKETEEGVWLIHVTSVTKGYADSVYTLRPVAGMNAQQNITLRQTSSGDHVHTWGAWAVTTQATCSSPGVETRTCTQDASHKETRAIAQLTGTACNSGGGSFEMVTIGGLKWMTENLNVETKYCCSWCYGEDGPVRVDGEWKTLTSSEIQANCAKYGRLYYWYGAKPACQSIGKRLPTNEEWYALVRAVGSPAGKKLKSTSGWNDFNGQSGNGTDDFGFSALPGGYSGEDGGSLYAGDFGGWWTATEYGRNDAYRWIITKMPDENGSSDYRSTNEGYSVRCVEDI